MDQHRIHGVWSSRWTFVLAATGSAVGLGNIWKFPYIAGENGGGAFVLVYLLCIMLIGIPIMTAEVLLGRMGRQSPVNTMRYVISETGAPKVWSGIGWGGVIGGLFILSFYSVVAGWALHYVVLMFKASFVGVAANEAQEHFTSLLASPKTLLMWHSIFIVTTACIVAAGVNRGLSMVARYLMPLLFFMLVVLLGYGFVQGNFAEAAAFLFSFDFQRLSHEGVLIAMGHAFFTLSLGMGAIMAYGAYMPDHAKVGATVVTVGLLDTLVALAAGMAIFPLVFANGLEAGSGPGLLFQTLPLAFGHMPFGMFFGALFFILVSIAAWSSAVSLIEPAVAWLVETKRFTRPIATAILASITWVLGISCALSFNLLADFKPIYLFNQTPFDFLDFLTAQIMLPLGGMFIALFVGWYVRKAVVEKEMDAEGHPLIDVWYFVIRWVSPALVFVVFAYTLYGTIKKLM